MAGGTAGSEEKGKNCALKIMKKNWKPETRNWALSLRRMEIPAKMNPMPRKPEMENTRTTIARPTFWKARPPTRKLTMRTPKTQNTLVKIRMAKMRDRSDANLLAGVR